MSLYNDGERPEEEDPGSVIRSKNRYKTAIKFVRNSIVLDYGCGVGLGYSVLKDVVKTYIGYDKCEEAINDAMRRNPKAAFVSIDLVRKFYTEKIVLDPGSVILGLEVIEHLEKDELVSFISMVSELKFKCYFTTPDGDFYPYHPASKEQRVGHHTWHYTYKELKQLFESHFNYVDIFGLERDENISKFVTYGIYAE